MYSNVFSILKLIERTDLKKKIKAILFNVLVFFLIYSAYWIDDYFNCIFLSLIAIKFGCLTFES